MKICSFIDPKDLVSFLRPKSSNSWIEVEFSGFVAILGNTSVRPIK